MELSATNVRQSQLSWAIAIVAIASGQLVAHLRRRSLSRAMPSQSLFEVKYYEVIGDSGATVGRGFCPNCGSRLFSKPQNPELMGILAGSLDEPGEFQPRIDFYTASAQPWDYMNPDLPKFAKVPPPETVIAMRDRKRTRLV